MHTLRLLTAGLAMSLLALGAHALEAEFHSAPPRAISIGEISIGEALAAKTGEYGERDVAQLVELLRADLEREFRRIGRFSEPATADAVLAVVIEDAMPNRPTAQQQARSPRPIDPRSLFVGGAKVSAILHDADGDEVGRFYYQWQTRPDVRASADAVTWTDARRTFDRFAKRLADAVAAQPSAS